MRKKTDLLKNLALFSSLGEKELEVVARYSRYYRYPKGEVIFHEGDQEGELYIIESGVVRIWRHERINSGDMGGRSDENVERGRDLARFIPGECFGELDLIDRTPRSEVAVAQEDTTLLVFPQKGLAFKDIARRHPEIFAEVFRNILAVIAGRIRRANRLISEKAPWVQELKRQLISDKLTGLYNRTFLEEDLRDMLPGYGTCTSLLMVKPDNFKLINDTFGHEAGDRVLKMIADALRTVLRTADMAVRYRGDEFAAVLPNTGAEQAVTVAKEVQAAIKKMSICHITGGKIDRITVSLGISTYPLCGRDNLELIRGAFDRMLEARNRGGDRILSA